MTWYRNGNIARQYDWNKGTPVNAFEERREDGSLACKGAYKDGKLHGTVNWYAPGGEVTASEKYRHGEIVRKKEKKDKKDKTGKPEDKMAPAGTTAPVAAEEKKKRKGLFRSRKDRDTTVQVTPPPIQTTEEQAPKDKSKKRSRVKKTTQPILQDPATQPANPDPEKKKKRRKKDKADDPQTP